jgi:hypothetical protein
MCPAYIASTAAIVAGPIRSAREFLYGSSLMLTYFLARALSPRTNNLSERSQHLTARRKSQ